MHVSPHWRQISDCPRRGHKANRSRKGRYGKGMKIRKFDRRTVRENRTIIIYPTLISPRGLLVYFLGWKMDERAGGGGD